MVYVRETLNVRSPITLLCPPPLPSTEDGARIQLLLCDGEAQSGLQGDRHQRRIVRPSAETLAHNEKHNHTARGSESTSLFGSEHDVECYATTISNTFHHTVGMRLKCIILVSEPRQEGWRLETGEISGHACSRRGVL